MNNSEKNKEIIESGMLERFVFGQCTEHELSELVPLIEQNPELKEEINRIEETLIQVAFSQSVTPGENLKEKIFSTIDATDNITDSKIIKMKRRGAFLKKENAQVKFYLYAASILLLLSLGTNAVLFTNYNGAKNELAELRDSRRQIAAEFASLRDAHDDLNQQFTLVTNPFVRQIDLEPTKENSDINAKIYFNNNNGNVILNLAGLQALPKDKQYQLWALVGGSPVDLGTFDGGIKTSILKIMMSVNKPDAFAVTVEPYGGSKNPTIDQMVMFGKLS
jgi:hypothetical protein